MLEAAVCGTFPVVCKDNRWVSEFGLDDFAAEPNAYDLAKKVIDINYNPMHYWGILDKLRPVLLDKFHPKRVAERIIEVYNKL